MKLKATTRAEKLDAVAVSIPSGVSLEMLLKKPELMLEIPWGASKILNALDQMEEEPRRDGNKIKLGKYGPAIMHCIILMALSRHLPGLYLSECLRCCSRAYKTV